MVSSAVVVAFGAVLLQVILILTVVAVPGKQLISNFFVVILN